MSYQVGQTVFLVPRVRYLGQPREVVISKVGRVWVEIEEGRHRFRKENGRLDGHNCSLGDIYATAAEYHEEVAHAARMRKIQDHFKWLGRNNTTREQAIQIAEILGIKDEEEVSSK